MSRVEMDPNASLCWCGSFCHCCTIFRSVSLARSLARSLSLTYAHAFTFTPYRPAASRHLITPKVHSFGETTHTYCRSCRSGVKNTKYLVLVVDADE